ncbi:unnamed protein product [Mytilus coruscus]|uniref:Uncharacterized protein n=1 Tax=Mytilus coruscus TaxID=42192 RepID=A0A6J8B9F6_MYTCO|nr:unnamed protein product [Mytilus coruscus]
MAFHIDHIGLEFEKTGSVCKVPNNPKAKLMYYLQSMCTVLQLDETEHDIKRFTDFENYYSLSNEETAAMVLLCTLLDPVTLNGVCIFHDEDACGNFENEFFKIEANRTRIASARSVMVGNVQVAIKKFMCYKMSWIEENYIEPLTQMIDRIQKANRQPQRRLHQRREQYHSRQRLILDEDYFLSKEIGVAAAVVFCRIYGKTIINGVER